MSRRLDSAPALPLDEGNAKRQKRHEGGSERDKGPPRPAEAGGLEQESKHYEGQTHSGHESQELILGQTTRYREVADPERGDEHVEHQHDGVQHCDEQPTVDTEPVGGEGTDAVPGQPEGNQEDQGGGADNPILTTQGVQPLSGLPTARCGSRA